MNLEIGGGLTCAEGFENLDPEHGQGLFKRTIQEGIPLVDSTVEQMRAIHVMEHVPAGADRLNAMNEMHRVLAPGGELLIGVPVLFTQDGVVHWEAVADPTHVSWWVYESFLYFTGERFAQADYGIRLWKMVGYAEEGGCAECLLQKP